MAVSPSWVRALIDAGQLPGLSLIFAMANMRERRVRPERSRGHAAERQILSLRLVVPQAGPALGRAEPLWLRLGRAQ